jgi:hypothetical protein
MSFDSQLSFVLCLLIRYPCRQWHRTGTDYISEQSDKTIDVVHSSRIVNLSLGARRTMTLRTKKDAANTTGNEQGGDDGDGGAATGVQRTTQRVPLPNTRIKLDDSL